jgi:anti-sigma B factor antagonist
MDFELRPVGPPAGSRGMVPAVQIHGDVDAANATDLGNALRDLATPALIIDLSLIGYFDSAGFAMIDRLLDEIQVVVVISPDSLIRPAAELVNLPFYDNVTDARKSMEPALVARGLVLTVPAPVVAQSWRGSARQVQLARLLAGCDVEALDEQQARSVGALAAVTCT